MEKNPVRDAMHAALLELAKSPADAQMVSVIVAGVTALERKLETTTKVADTYRASARLLTERAERAERMVRDHESRVHSALYLGDSLTVYGSAEAIERVKAMLPKHKRSLLNRLWGRP